MAYGTFPEERCGPTPLTARRCLANGDDSQTRNALRRTLEDSFGARPGTRSCSVPPTARPNATTT